MSKERKETDLSEKEKKRLKKFETTKAKMIKDGYKVKDLTVNAVSANIMAFVTPLPFVVLFFLIYIILGNTLKGISNDCFTIAIIINLVFGIFVHEFIHGFTWTLCSKKMFKDIEFGFIVKTCNPYCTCSTPLKKYQYVLGSAMPGIVLGIIPSIIAIIFGSPILLLSGAFQLFGAGGDALIVYKVLLNKTKSKDVLYYDHPTEIGVLYFEK